GRDVLPENALRGLVAGKRPSGEIVGAGIANVLRDGRIDGAKTNEARGQSALRRGILYHYGEHDRGSDDDLGSAPTNDRGTTHRNDCLGTDVQRPPAPILIDPGKEARRAAAVGIVRVAELRAQQPLFRTYTRDERRDRERRQQHADA